MYQGMIPVKFPFHPEHIPPELKEARCWVCCDREKVPMIPGTRRRASSTDPKTWRTYRVAVGAIEACPNLYAGVGRVIRRGEGIVGIDLDGVRDGATRATDPWALEIMDSLDS